jgi:dTDP-4-dehydrorhamnose reductase
VGVDIVKVVVLGASGIIGQHMALTIPPSISASFYRRSADLFFKGADLECVGELDILLANEQPDIVINLAGESNTDTVERSPSDYDYLNSTLPSDLSARLPGKRLIHISSQAVFDGLNPPYHPSSPTASVNYYGAQKIRAEKAVMSGPSTWTILRPTFVLGVRPFPHVGRTNPIEQMLSGQHSQVTDRHFSPLFARDAAFLIWKSIYWPTSSIYHLGNPYRTSRYDIAEHLGIEPIPASHHSFPSLAPRPLDTTYAEPSSHITGFNRGIDICRHDYADRSSLSLPHRAREIALFLGITEDAAVTKLQSGFHPLHRAVALDFNLLPYKTDDEILEWYRTTDSYIWELSAYHLDPGFAYMRMVKNFCDRLLQLHVKSALVLGDGIGDMTLYLNQHGVNATYHDLAGSRTAAFAAFRYWLNTGKPLPSRLTDGWLPTDIGKWDAILSFDFMEHLTDVHHWTSLIRRSLTPGGWFINQNAFSAQGPTLPMHLPRNARYEKDWDPLLTSLSFRQESSNWYQSAS